MNLRLHLEQFANTVWYGGSRWWVVLWPFSMLYRGATAARRVLYSRGVWSSVHPGVPVVVVGNITAGGAGKTPLVMRLAQLLMARGIRPGVLMRGYRRRGAQKTPLLVDSATTVNEAGDEALMIFERLRVPVCVCRQRVAGSHALTAAGVDVILCDDGLQHYALQRDMEIVVVDNRRGFGNGQCLPAGPLRELPARLESVNLVVAHAGAGDETRAATGRHGTMQLHGSELISLDGSQRRSLQSMQGKTVNAVAGIGAPERFFATLRAAGLIVNSRRFPDHHHYAEGDLDFAQQHPLLMTEKDAVKCRNLAVQDAWYLQVDAVVTANVEQVLFDTLSELLKDKAATLQSG